MKVLSPPVTAWVATLLLARPGLGVPPPSTPFDILKPGTSQPAPKQISKADDPTVVWRGEYHRTPQEVMAAGGFYPGGTELAMSGGKLTPLQQQQGSSLYYHAQGETQEFSRFVSTSSKPDVAASMAMNPHGLNKPSYLYMIRPDAKMIDVEATLGSRVPFPGEAEQAFAGFVPLEQIEGWYDLRRTGFRPDTFVKLANGQKLEKHFEPNPHFNGKKYEATKGSGMQPQLAGFPDGDEFWQVDPWAKFRDQSVVKNVDTFIANTIAHPGAPRMKPLPAAGKSILKEHSEGESTRPKKKVTFSDNCRRDASGCIATKPVEGDVGKGKVDAEKPVAAGNKGAPKPSGDEIGLEKTPGKDLGGRRVSSKGLKLVKGIGYLQVAQFLTAVVDSTAYHLNQSSPEEEQRKASPAQQAKMKTFVGEAWHLLAAVANDTVPGSIEIQEQLQSHWQRVQSIEQKPHGLEKALLLRNEFEDHCGQVLKILADNFVPIYAEGRENYKKKTLEFDDFNGTETAEQRNQRRVELIVGGVAGTANDVLRNYLPAYKKAQDVTKEEAVVFLNEVFDAADDGDEGPGFVDVLGMWAKFQARAMARTVYRFLQNSVPGEKQLEQFFADLPETPASVWSATAEDWASPCAFCWT